MKKLNSGFVEVTIAGIGLGVLTLVIFLLMGPFSFIGPGQRGVEVDRGRVTGHVYTEGWYVYNSLTKDIVEFDVRTHTDEADADAASNDQQDVKVKVAVTYRLDDTQVANMLRTIGREQDIKTKIIDPQMQESVKAAIAKHNVEETLDKRVEIKQQIFDDLSTRLSKYGVILQEIALKNINFSEDFEKAVEEKARAEQKLKQAQFEADATVKVAEAKAKEQTMLKESLTPDVLKRLAIEKWNGAFPTYFGGGVLPFLEIGK